MVSESDGIEVDSALQRRASCPLFGTKLHCNSNVTLLDRYMLSCWREREQGPMEADESLLIVVM